MSSPTVPTPAPDEGNGDRVAPCQPYLADDLGSIVIECHDRRPDGWSWHMTHVTGDTDEAGILAAFAAHRAACEARK